MILGRNTQQWMGLITALAGLLTASLPIVAPDGIGGIEVTGLITLVGLVTTFLGSFIAFIAATSTTPTSDPRLPIGQTVNAGLANPGVVVPAGSGVTGVPAGTAVIEAPAVVVESPK